MTLRAINWTEGEVGHIHLRMRPGECRVDWGDGRSEVIRRCGLARGPELFP